MERERRDYLRIPVKVVANCMRCKSGERIPEHFISFTKDISVQGARIILSKNVEAGSTVTLGLEVPTSFIPVLVHSQVMWAQSVMIWGEGCHSFSEAGVRFVELNEFDEERLTAFLKNRCKEATVKIQGTELHT